jgi:hypothetical protein
MIFTNLATSLTLHSALRTPLSNFVNCASYIKYQKEHPELSPRKRSTSIPLLFSFPSLSEPKMKSSDEITDVPPPDTPDLSIQFHPNPRPKAKANNTNTKSNVNNNVKTATNKSIVGGFFKKFGMGWNLGNSSSGDSTSTSNSASSPASSLNNSNNANPKAIISPDELKSRKKTKNFFHL